jgi:hypothetical protein
VLIRKPGLITGFKHDGYRRLAPGISGLTEREEMSNAIFGRREITTAEREARKAFREVEAAKPMTEQEKTQKAFDENRVRLKAERLAREAAEPKVK